MVIFFQYDSLKLTNQTFMNDSQLADAHIAPWIKYDKSWNSTKETT